MSTLWDTDQHKARSRIGSGTVVVDLGASTGEFAIPAAHAGANVIAVEALKENCDTLLDGRLEKVIHAAAAPWDGWCRIETPAGAEWRTGSYILSDVSGPIRAISLKSIVGLAGGQVDVLKCDIEGGEYGLFESADSKTLSAIVYIAIETHAWTTGGEAQREGVGHRDKSPVFESGSGEALVEKLSKTHNVTVQGPLDCGALVFAERRAN